MRNVLLHSKVLCIGLVVATIFTACSAKTNVNIGSSPNPSPVPGSSNNAEEVKPGSDSDEMQSCTLEAKICPDGSAVGRTGPKCEFAACPENATPQASTAPGASPILLPSN